MSVHRLRHTELHMEPFVAGAGLACSAYALPKHLHSHCIADPSWIPQGFDPEEIFNMFFG